MMPQVPTPVFSDTHDNALVDDRRVAVVSARGSTAMGRTGDRALMTRADARIHSKFLLELASSIVYNYRWKTLAVIFW
jgi:hypothetical protein